MLETKQYTYNILRLEKILGKLRPAAVGHGVPTAHSVLQSPLGLATRMAQENMPKLVTLLTFSKLPLAGVP